MSFAIIKHNTYYDSVTLMIVTSEIIKLPEIVEASVCMGTELNKGLLEDRGLSNADTENATANDLIIAYETSDGLPKEGILTTLDGLLKKKNQNEDQDTATTAPISLKTGLLKKPDVNLAIISVPGRYAYIEAQKALLQGLHVMLFSDNVTLDEEKMLKTYARDKGLLMMGPDCGTSIINGVGLCFANEVRHGSIGIVGASGTGIQEVTALIDQFGGGITQAIGVGGRDLTDEIGGIMMMEGLKLLGNDTNTEVILLLSKKPSDAVAEKIMKTAEVCGKPVVICFLGFDEIGEHPDNIHLVSTFEQAAIKSLELTGETLQFKGDNFEYVEKLSKRLSEVQKRVKGLFCGGSLCSESKYVFRKHLEPNGTQFNHEFLDLGDDQFTVGRPHPMIDPTLRNKQIVLEANDKETAVIILDFVLGYGANENPAGVALNAIQQAKSISENIVIIGYVCGTANDFQGLQRQKDILQSAGVILAESNAHAARIAAEVMRRKNDACQ